ncbi:unnamed protein product [Clavelina lepadiformis]|uniref:Uncharacterized protein n=1 Tax=Clavelina lepadiformis TaxID=159417 RepID=A0ABP0GXX2_CLALP
MRNCVDRFCVTVTQSATLASKTQTESVATSSKTYLLVVPTVAPSNSEQSKRQAVGNLITPDKNSSQYFHFLEDDPQQKTLKRKVPTTIGPVSGPRSLHFNRNKEPVSIRPYPQQPIPTSPPPSRGSSTSSLSSISYQLSTGSQIQGPIAQQEVNDQESYNLTKQVVQSSSSNTEQSTSHPPSSTESLGNVSLYFRYHKIIDIQVNNHLA